MTVGIPGVGFGGIFYLLSALFMPARELSRTLRGDTSRERWRLVAGQWSMAMTIVAALWVTGWALGHVLAPVTTMSAGPRGASAGAIHNVLKISALALSVGMLVALIAVVRVAHLVLRHRGAIPAQHFEPMRPARGPLPHAGRPGREKLLQTGTGGHRRIDSGHSLRRSDR